jgi:uroporphyrinogen-III decarboxylase
MKLSPRERVLAAMNLQQPDKVPLMCQFSIGAMMQQLKPSPADFWYDGEIFARGLVELCERFRFDGILVSLHGHNPHWMADTVRIDDIEEGRQEVIYENRKEIHSWTDLPVVKFYNKGEERSVSSVDVSKEIPSFIDYIPVSQDLHFRLHKEHMFDIFDCISSKTGGKYSVHGEITSPFDYLLDFLGYENALVSLILDPPKCKDILQKFTDGICELVGGMCEKDIDAVKISSPFAGMGFISPEHYQEFVLPYESQIIKVIRGNGRHAYIHTCGHIGDRLELMKMSGASGLECLDPPPVGNVDLADAFARIGESMFIKGNIDSVNTLLFADDAKAREDVLKIIRLGKNGRGFILSTACSVAPMVPKERILMLRELVDQYGSYS